MNIEERLTRIEAHLFGKAEQPKPPLGAKPKWLIQENRRDELALAINRYEEAGQQVPQEWIDEHRELETALELRHNEKSKPPKFEAFYVDCTREEYSEVKRILEAQGYELKYTEWLEGDDCVTTTNKGVYMPYEMSDKIEDEPVYTLPQLREKFGVEQPQEQLRDFVVPLTHATLTREEVAARCVSAAEKKGCKPICYNELATLEGHVNKFGEGDARFFVCEKDGVYMFVHDHDGVSIATTLEAFEEYCGVGQPQQYVGLADETAEPQVHGIVNTLDAPAKPKTRIEWLNELPDGYRERALANCTEWNDGKPTDKCVSMQYALSGMCQWADTPEDWYFWDAVYLHYAHDQPLPPLPTGNSENPNDHEATEKLTYDAGFWFAGKRHFLKLPDCTTLWLHSKTHIWRKTESMFNTPQPHTLTPVSQHTVGKFYALAGASGAHLNDYQNYALCVATGETTMFVRASTEYGVVLVERARERDVTLNEVTPV